MKYCLFCRDSFEDDFHECPYCSGELVDELPDENENAVADLADDADDVPSVDVEGPDELLPVAIIHGEDDLRAVVEALKSIDVYFEIDEVERTEALVGIIPGRAWRILIEPDAAEDVFLQLVETVPHVFPASVAAKVAAESRTDETPNTAERVVEILSAPPSEAAAAELARAVVESFASDDPSGVARTRYVLAKEPEFAGSLLTAVAVKAVSAGGDGAERVIFNAMQVLEVIGHDEALAPLEALYRSPVAQVRARAAYAAGRLALTKAVDALLDLLDDQDEDVRYEASESIWRLSGLDFAFEPYAPIEREAENVARLRQAWDVSAGGRGVRSPLKLSDLLADDSGDL